MESPLMLHPCATWHARLTVTGCQQNQKSLNENTRAICRACQSPIAPRVAGPVPLTFSELQSQRGLKSVAYRNHDGRRKVEWTPFKHKLAAVAQPVEQPTCNRQVRGSRPLGGSKKKGDDAKSLAPGSTERRIRPALNASVTSASRPTSPGRPPFMGKLRYGKLQTRPGWRPEA